jgi:hypothetical protein
VSTKVRVPQAGLVEVPGVPTQLGSGLVEVPGVPTLLSPGGRKVGKPNPRGRPGKPGVIFKRSDTPFVGEGTRVSLSEEKGLTKPGYLDVPFRFQIPPQDGWQRSFTGRMNNFDVLGGAQGPLERSRPGGPGLETVTFRTMFMDYHPEWGVWEPDLLEPVLAIRQLRQFARLNLIFWLKVRSTLYDHFDVDILATITQGDVEEVAGEPETRYINLTFQEYDELDAERKRRQRGHGQNQGPWNHTIKAGDTLYKLARSYYKTQRLWPAIAAANPHMRSWPPSRDLMAWGKREHRSRVHVPVKPSIANQGTGKRTGPNTAAGVGAIIA